VDECKPLPTGRLVESLSVSHAAVIILSQYFQDRTSRGGAGAGGGGGSAAAEASEDNVALANDGGGM
jgi:hypothetical protein